MEKNKNYNSEKYKHYKFRKKDIITWVKGGDILLGQHIFTFDNVHFFDFFADYPDKLTPEQKRIVDKERPELAELLSDDVECPDDDYDDEDDEDE